MADTEQMHSREEMGFGADATAAPDMPPGDHPLEVAARKGIGPLSPAGRGAWHGECQPCVSCGQLVPRGAHECDSCGQDLSDDMRRRMSEAAGPWMVFEHVRPFPGISFERLVRQVRRGVVTSTSIVRGPTTDFQWRFAGETPGLSKHLGMCWHCGEAVMPADTYCPACLTHLDGAPQAAPLTESTIVAMHLPPPETSPRMPARVAPTAAPARPSLVPTAARNPVSVRAASAASPSAAGLPTAAVPTAARPVQQPNVELITEELRALTAVLEERDSLKPETFVEEPVRIAGVRATWLIGFVFVVLFAGLIGVIKLRQHQTQEAGRSTSRPAAVEPAP